MAEEGGMDFVVGVAVDHDRQPDYALLARRGVRAYRFPLRWSRVVTSTTFYHDEPAMPLDDNDLAPCRGPDPCARPVADDDVASWPHDDPRWRAIHADAWADLPTAEAIIDLDVMHYYRVLMSTLRAHDIEPVPVLDPRDMPPVLRGVIGGWGSLLAIEAYAQFARAAFVQLGHLANLWLGLVLSVEPLGRGPYAHRAMRHMALGHARAASIYYRDLAGAMGVVRGRFGAIVECGPVALDPSPSLGTDNVGQANLDRLLRVFQRPLAGSTTSMTTTRDHTEDDGFGWGFTQSQKILVSRSADIVVLDCTLPRPAKTMMGDQDAESRGTDDPTRHAADDMALMIDHAAAVLPGAILVVCDGSTPNAPPYDPPYTVDSDNMDQHLGDRTDLEDDHTLGLSDTIHVCHLCLFDRDGGDCGNGVDNTDGQDTVTIADNDLYDDEHDQEMATCLRGRLDAVRAAASAGRPVSAYLLRLPRSRALSPPYADPFCL